MSVHISPSFRDDHMGDVVTMGECRPQHNILKANKGSSENKINLSQNMII